MATTRRTTMQFALRAAAVGKLEDAWLYLPSKNRPELHTPCLIIDAEDTEDQHAIASAEGFPQEGLDTPTIEDTTQCAREYEKRPSDALLLESFTYYWLFDAFLPHPGAPDPPPLEEAQARLDRDFYEVLGAERREVPCRSVGCSRGAIAQSVFCRPHHFEAIKHKPCPYAD